jgi:hypothetical protein
MCARTKTPLRPAAGQCVYVMALDNGRVCVRDECSLTNGSKQMIVNGQAQPLWLFYEFICECARRTNSTFVPIKKALPTPRIVRAVSQVCFFELQGT